MLIISNQQCTNCLDSLLRINKKWSLKQCLCKLRKERSCYCDCVVIPSNKEDDEMRQALIALQD